MLSDTEAAVVSNIYEDELIILCRSLVKIPSETGNEKEVSDFCVGYMQSLGMDAHGIEGQAGRPNALGSITGQQGRRTLQLFTHLDTMPVGDRPKWNTDPYGGEVVDGKIYGRGVLDSKGGGMAAMLIATKAVIQSGIRLKDNLILAGLVDGEVDGRWGMRYLVEEGYINPDLCVYASHSDLQIMAHFKGLLWAKLSIKGKAAHGGMPWQGKNAVLAACEFINMLKTQGISYAKHPVLGDSTYNVGWIKAGEKYNVVPDVCELGIDMRLVPGQSTHATFEELSSILSELRRRSVFDDAKLEMVLSVEPVSVPDDEPVLRATSAAAEKVLGHPPKIRGHISGGALPPVFAKGRNGIAFGPGDLERGNAHREDEFLELDQLIAAAKVYAILILDACGGY